MKLEALVAVVMVLLMYLPYAFKGALEGLALYTYWSLVALATLVYAWIETGRWSRSE